MSHYRGIGVMSLLFIHLVIYVGFVHDKFSLIMVKHIGGGHSPNARPNSTIASLKALYFENAPTLGFYFTHFTIKE